MHGLFRAFRVIAVIAGIAPIVAGCNIFGLDDSSPEDEAAALRAELEAFVDPKSTDRMTARRLYEIAKSAREGANIGILTIAYELSQTDPDGDRVSYPFGTLSPVERLELAAHLHTIERALGLILYANRAGIRSRLGPGLRPAANRSRLAADDDSVRAAAGRVVISGRFEPCSFYTDYVAVRLLAVMLDFRIRLDAVAGSPQIGVGPGGYAIAWANPAAVDAAAARAFDDALADMNERVDGSVRPALEPYETFGCPTSADDILDVAQIALYVDGILLRSLGAYAIDTGDAGNPGIGDNDGDGRTNEETIDGRDEDNDGRIDEDARR